MAEPNAPPLREPTLGELRTAFLTQADYNIRQTTNGRATMADIDEARMDPGPRPPMPKKIKKLQDLELEMGNMLDEARELIHSCRTPFANGMSTDDVLRFAHRLRGTGGAPPERVAPRPSRQNARPDARRAQVDAGQADGGVPAAGAAAGNHARGRARRARPGRVPRGPMTCVKM